MKKFLSYAVSGILAAVLSACTPVLQPTGPVTERTHSYSTELSRLEVGGGIRVEIDRRLPEGKFLISTNENIHDYIRVSQRHGTLSVGLDTYGMSYGSLDIRMFISPYGFDSYTLEGGASMTSSEPLERSSLEIFLSGGSRLVSDMRAEKLELEVSGGSSVAAGIEAEDVFAVFSGGSRAVMKTGNCRFLNLECSGGSIFDGFELVSRKLDLLNSGGSVVRITVTESIICDNSGGSKLYFKGSPTSVIIQNSGGSIAEPAY